MYYIVFLASRGNLLVVNYLLLFILQLWCGQREELMKIYAHPCCVPMHLGTRFPTRCYLVKRWITLPKYNSPSSWSVCQPMIHVFVSFWYSTEGLSDRWKLFFICVLGFKVHDRFRLCTWYSITCEYVPWAMDNTTRSRRWAWQWRFTMMLMLIDC